MGRLNMDTTQSRSFLPLAPNREYFRYELTLFIEPMLSFAVDSVWLRKLPLGLLVKAVSMMVMLTLEMH